MAYSEPIFDMLVNEVGINRVRIGVSSGMEKPVDYWARFVNGEIGYQGLRRGSFKINDNDDPLDTNLQGFQFSQLDYEIENVVFPMRTRLEARGERLFVNLCFHDFRTTAEGSNMEHALAPQEYSELILAAFQHLRERYGLTPDALEIILEPENTAYWRGEQIGRALTTVATRLAENGFHPQFIAPSTTLARNAPEYIDGLMQVPGAANVISTFAYHNYDNPPDSVREAIWSRARRAGVSTAMLEHLPSDARELYRDLTVANVSAWQQWGVAHLDTPERDQQGAYLLLVDPDRPPGRQVRMASRTGGLAQFFRNIRIGAVRVQALSDNPRKQVVAFVNPDETHVVVVVAKNGGPLSIEGLPAGIYEASFAPENGAPRALDEVLVAPREPLRSRIPERGVLALRQQPAN
jgi:hypothetical protein